MGFQLEQVQDFTPTPMTVATVIYYSGYHPYTLKKMFAPKSERDKRAQHKFFFWYKNENKDWIENRLNKANRPDLIKRLLGDQPKNKSANKPKWLAEKHRDSAKNKHKHYARKKRK